MITLRDIEETDISVLMKIMEENDDSTRFDAEKHLHNP